MLPRRKTGLRRHLAVPAAVGTMILAGCSSGGADSGDTATASTTGAPTATGTAGTATGTATGATTADPAGDTPAADASASDTGTVAPSGAGPVSLGDLGAVGTLASSEIHDVTIEFDTAEYDAMLATYIATEAKEWISATVTIDGISYEDVGLRLKGNSSLRGVTADTDPATIPWLVKLDEFVDDQNHDGLEEFVIRASSSATALNEAVALELLDLAGLASQDAVSVRLSVNGGEQVSRLVIDSPDGEWMAEEFSDTGALYKAESTGDWTYRGEDPAAYDDVFDQEAGDDNADLTPLIELLEFVNDSDDATFEAELADRLDVESFATYLAMQDLLDNFDDINGPGNNAYLYYDTGTERFTVVPWDYNLAFGQRPMGGGAGGGGFPGGDGDRPAPPEGFDPGQAGGDMPAAPGRAPDDTDTGADTGTADSATAGDTVILIDPNATGAPGGGRDMPGGGPGGGMNRANPLVDRFLAVDAWNELYEQAKADLQASLFDSGTASAVLAKWSSIVAGSGLVDQSTIDSDAAAIATYFG